MKFLKKIFSGIFGLKFNLGSYLLIIFPILFLALSMMEFFKVIKFDIAFRGLFSKEEYFWFFSTAAQAMAALFGIGGMFAAFVLQIINNRYDKNFEDAKGLSHNIGLDLLGDTEFLQKLQEWIEAQEKEGIFEDTLYHEFKRMKGNIDKYSAKKKGIIKAFKMVIIFMTSVILISLLALPVSYYLSQVFLGLAFGIFFMILMLVTVLKLARFIFVSIKD